MWWNNQLKHRNIILIFLVELESYQKRIFLVKVTNIGDQHYLRWHKNQKSVQFSESIFQYTLDSRFQPMSYPDLTGRRQGDHISNAVVEVQYVTYYTCSDYTVNKPSFLEPQRPFFLYHMQHMICCIWILSKGWPDMLLLLGEWINYKL